MKVKTITAFITIVWLLSLDVVAETSPYSGQKEREIKALSEEEVSGLLSGKGMGYAKAAELNGYPGPAHVLKLSEELELTPTQETETEMVFEWMESAAKDLGARLVAAERELDQMFRNKTITVASLSEHVAKIGRIESQLRELHLRAHLQQTQLLSDHQIAKYGELRGYARGGHEGHHHGE